MSEELSPPEGLLLTLYGHTATELGMTSKKRDELIVASMFGGHLNDEHGSSYQVPATYYRENTEKEDASGIDVTLRQDDGQELRLQIKGIHIARAIERKRAGVQKMEENVVGDAVIARQREDSQQLIEEIEPQLTKLQHVDYGGTILLIHVQGETATQSSLDSALEASAALLQRIRADEIWFIQNVPLATPEDKRAQCCVYRLVRWTPTKQIHFYHFG